MQIKFVAIVISNTGTALFYTMGLDMGLDFALEGKACLVPARDPQRPFRDNALLQETDRRKGILQRRRQLKHKVKPTEH